MENRLLSPHAWNQPVNRLRQALTQGIDTALGKREFAGIIRALAVGDRETISHAQWQTLIATGTNHLVAISGLHVGMVAGLCEACGPG